MTDRAANFEWHQEGEEAEAVIYAPDATIAEACFERALPATRLLGIMSPIYAAASSVNSNEFGWVVASESHVAPSLFSAPEWGLLLTAETAVKGLGVPEEVPRLIDQKLSEVVLPDVGQAEAQRLCEFGSLWAAEKGLIEEEDVPHLNVLPGDSDALGGRALSAGSRDWTRPGRVRALRVQEILDSDRAEDLGLEVGSLAFVVGAGAEDLGRLCLASHRERISARASSGDFGTSGHLPAAPIDSQEARDIVAAAYAAANYAAGRTALVVYALRQALEEVGALNLQTAWVIGGIDERDGHARHRNGLVALGAGETFVGYSSVSAGTGRMIESAPPFEARKDERWVWEEAGILTRWATLVALRHSGEAEV
jgi:hypothetical protein